MELLKEKGLPVSHSDLLRELTRPCFAPHLPYREQIGHSVIYGPMPKSELRHLLTPRFLVWAEPLIAAKEAIVRLDELSDGAWTLSIWVSLEYLFRQQLQEWGKEMEAEEKEKTKIPNTTMTVYMTGKEKRAARKRAEKMHLKRARDRGESRMVRVVATHVLSEFLKHLQAEEDTQPTAPGLEGETPNA